MPADPAEILLNEATKWRRNRAVYPGWLIAPEPVRDRLWLHTKNWLLYYTKHRAKLSALDDLSILSEVNWRLETALLPIWTELTTAYEEALASVNPFPQHISDLAGAALTPASQVTPTPEWLAVRAQWLEVACGLLRYYREERRHAEFDAWQARLARVTDASADIKARVCYERCLFALAEMNDGAVEAALRDWPAETRDTFWAVRRAGVLAEIGRVSAAIPLLDGALQSVRSGSVDTATHIPALSREGWALWLGRGLHRSVELRDTRREGGLTDDAAERAGLRRRFRSLARFGADPNLLAEGLTSRLEQPPPQEPPHVVERVGFDPGTVRRTFQSGQGLGPKLIPAYQFMRLSEESGIPPSFGSVSFTKKTLVRAAEWFREHDPVRTQSLMFRLLDKEVTDTCLTRHRVATLPTDLVGRWREATLRAIRSSLPTAGRGFRDRSDGEKRSRDRFDAAARLLSRVLVRDTPAELSEAWDLALELYRSEVVRSGVDDAYRELLSSLIRTSPPDQLAARLRALFDLPLAAEPGFPVWNPYSWPDPAVHTWDHLPRGRGPRPGPEWRAIVNRHLGQLKDGSAELRRGALWRLYALTDLGLLTPAEDRRAANAFWEPIGRRDELPWDPWGPAAPRFALRWPAPRGLSAADRVKKYIFETTLSAVHGGAAHESLFNLVQFATRFGRTPSGSPREFIDWSAAELGILFGKIRVWWDTHGRTQAEGFRQRGVGFMDDRSAFRSFFNSLWDVIRSLILPGLRPQNPVAADVLGFIQDVSANGLPVGAVLPCTLLLRPGDRDQVASTLRREFAHAGIEYHLSALRGIVFWAAPRFAGRGRRALPQIPTDLVREVGVSVAVRRPGALRLALDGSLALLRVFGRRADEQFRESLLVGLDYLGGEAAYRERDDPTAAIDYDQVPAIRVYCVRLAKRLSEAGHAAHPAIRRWLDAAASDPLPEVRAATRDVAEEGDDD